MIERELSNQDLNRINEEAKVGGYSEARELVEQERQRRQRILLAMQAVDMAYVVPTDPMDDLICDGCE